VRSRARRRVAAIETPAGLVDARPPAVARRADGRCDRETVSSAAMAAFRAAGRTPPRAQALRSRSRAHRGRAASDAGRRTRRASAVRLRRSRPQVDARSPPRTPWWHGPPSPRDPATRARPSRRRRRCRGAPGRPEHAIVTPPRGHRGDDGNAERRSPAHALSLKTKILEASRRPARRSHPSGRLRVQIVEGTPACRRRRPPPGRVSGRRRCALRTAA